MAIDKGMYNFQGIMDEFYNWKPDGDDDEGRAMKNSFMANMVQSGFDSSLAKDMAHTQSGIAKGNMTHAADLDLRNKTALMNDEFNKGMMNMGGQFEFQNRFAEDQTVRDITQNTTSQASGFEFSERQNENQNIRDTTKDSTMNADNYEYGNRANENKSVTNVTENAMNAGAQFDYQDKLEDNRNIRDMAKTGFQGDENRKTLAATGTQNRLDMVTQGEQNRYGVMQQGDENRRSDSNKASEDRATNTSDAADTIGVEAARTGNTIEVDNNTAKNTRDNYKFMDTVEAGKQNRQSARARATARAF